MGRYVSQFDGLRAVAVLLVIGTHTGYVPGGYVGVDVFFVLSGYLITTILLGERARNQWSLKHFYIRRARRLYPALIVLLLVTLPFGGLLASSITHYATLAALTGTYVSDFAVVAHVNFLQGPLSHTWSLAVEEQFYLTWPVFLLLAFKITSRRVIIVATVLSAEMMLIVLCASGASSSSAMFLPIGRGGILLLGCTLALVLDHGPLPRSGLVAVVSAVGLGGAVIFAADKAQGGLAVTLAGLLATGLVGGILPGGMVARVLSFRPLTWLGERSYGVYLWHLPIVYVVAHHDVQPSQGSLRVLIPTLIGGIGLATVSYRYVETRFRPARSTRHRAGRAAPEARGSIRLSPESWAAEGPDPELRG
jgi:peptidoglycan/LPS O-acetylase OafA/YrhL